MFRYLSPWIKENQEKKQYVNIHIRERAKNGFEGGFFGVKKNKEKELIFS